MPKGIEQEKEKEEMEERPKMKKVVKITIAVIVSCGLVMVILFPLLQIKMRIQQRQKQQQQQQHHPLADSGENFAQQYIKTLQEKLTKLQICKPLRKYSAVTALLKEEDIKKYRDMFNKEQLFVVKRCGTIWSVCPDNHKCIPTVKTVKVINIEIYNATTQEYISYIRRNVVQHENCSCYQNKK